jgi:phosphoglycerol transferase MdoB-like AlkP superfamily enzyme
MFRVFINRFIAGLTSSPVNPVLLRLALLLPLYTISRLLIYPFSSNYFPELELSEIFRLTIAGLRFDLSAMLMVNSLYLLLSFFPWPIQQNRVAKSITGISFIAPNIIAILANLIDAGYFSYSFRRTSFDLFRVFAGEGALIRLLPDYSIDFWPIFLLAILFVAVILLIAGISSERVQPKPAWLRIMVFLSLGFLVITGVRGGLQRRPLWIVASGYSADASLTPLVTNTPFIVLKSLHKSRLDPQPLKTSLSYSAIHPGRAADKPDRLNVVIIILESVSAQHTGFLNPEGKSYTPFLDSIALEGSSFLALANGSRSIEAMPSILCGLPPLMDMDLIQSVYADNRISSVASLLRSSGYSSAFFHGGDNGSMSLDAFAGLAGFEHYFGRKEYGNDKDHDGHWGIFDEEFLSFTAGKLNEMTQPFVAGVFTLSSHHPYRIPDKHSLRFRAGEHPLLNSVAYADYSLGKFFEQASASEWYHETLFVICSDHASLQFGKAFNNKLMHRAIPLIFYRPGKKGLGLLPEIAQQSDILPSIIDSLDAGIPFVAFGQNVFGKDFLPFNIHYADGIYEFYRKDIFLQSDGSELLSAYRWKHPSASMPEKLITEGNKEAIYELEFMKAIVNEYNQRMTHNALFISRKLQANPPLNHHK